MVPQTLPIVSWTPLSVEERRDADFHFHQHRQVSNGPQAGRPPQANLAILFRIAAFDGEAASAARPRRPCQPSTANRVFSAAGRPDLCATRAVGGSFSSAAGP